MSAGQGSRTRTGRERGSVTAEFAVALPAVIAVLALVLAGVQAGILQSRLQDASAATARALARGDSNAAADRLLQRLVPGARLTRRDEGGLVCVRSAVRAEALLGMQVTAGSCALVEAR